jgi:succinate dehydrogenase flavin-adding protein (antitoxin of CptAB toxin-antitoxin module)
MQLDKFEDMSYGEMLNEIDKKIAELQNKQSLSPKRQDISLVKEIDELRAFRARIVAQTKSQEKNI